MKYEVTPAITVYESERGDKMTLEVLEMRLVELEEAFSEQTRELREEVARLHREDA